jgi:hypothetical protein
MAVPLAASHGNAGISGNSGISKLGKIISGKSGKLVVKGGS